MAPFQLDEGLLSPPQHRGMVASRDRRASTPSPILEAMSQTSPVESVATATTNTRPGSFVEVFISIEDDLFLFDALHEQVCVVPREHAKAFLQEANQMLVS